MIEQPTGRVTGGGLNLLHSILDELAEPSQSLIPLLRNQVQVTAGIIQALNLRRPIYQPTAAFGHFGRTDIDAPWEALDKVPMLRRGVGASIEKSDQTVNP